MSENNHHIESDRRLVTVMFADISGFTAMSEKMDPEEVSDVMKECFSMMEKIIDEYGGTIDKFIGDCVMVLFGAPKAQEDAPHRALNTALEIRKRLQRFNKEKQLLISLNIHIGINTGPVIAGLMGGDKRQDFTVMGDTVNLASRMEGVAQTGDILVAENTYRLTEGYFDFETLGEVNIKGKEQPVMVYKVLGPRRTITRIEACQEKGLSPFVGRNKELDHLKDRLEQVREGHGQVVGIVGEPGVGKSRLVCQFRESLPGEEYTIIEGGCVHFGDAIPYLPILDMLKDYFDISEDESEPIIKQKIIGKIIQLSEQLTPNLSPLYEVLSLKVEDEEYVKLDGKQRRVKVFEAIRLLLIAESQKKPLVVIFEDLHWMDKTSEEFLTSLIKSLATTRVMLIILFRPEYNPAAWVTKTFYSQIRVDQLPRKTIEDFVNGILGCGDVEPELIDFIANRTEGNPLFIEEMTNNLLENGFIKKDGKRYSLSLKPTDIQVPATIQGIIAARLDRLEGALKSIMQTASVIGREFAFRILQSVVALKDDLKSSLLTLQDLEFIYEKSLFPELEYIFKHALTQEVAYNSLLIKKRKETHERVGQAIEQIYSDRLEEFLEMLAYHYSLSENHHKAYEYLKLSGDKAAKNYSNWEAVRFYKEAVRVLDEQPDSVENKREKLKVLHLIFYPLTLLGFPKGTLAILQATERLSHELEDVRSLTRVYGNLGNYHTFKGNPELGIEYSEKYLDQAEKIGDISTMTSIAPQVCAANLLAGNFLKVFDIANKILPLFVEQHDKESHSEGRIRYSTITKYSLLCGQCGGLAMGSLGMFEEGKKILAKGLHTAYEADAKWAMGWVEGCHSHFSYWEGDIDETITHAEKSIRFFEETKNNFFAGNSWSMLGSGYYLRGDYTKMIQHIEKGIRIQKEEGVPTMLPYSYAFLASGYTAIGDLMRARDSVEAGLKIAHEAKTKAQEGLALMILGSIMGKADPIHIDDATLTIQKGITILKERRSNGIYSQGYLFMGELFADAEQKKEALQNLKKAEVMYLEMKVTPKSYWLKRARHAIAKLEATH
jgi:class 3 adenylate cyclase/tetratricopeptide (TPR) repeat protein